MSSHEHRILATAVVAVIAMLSACLVISDASEDSEAATYGSESSPLSSFSYSATTFADGSHTAYVYVGSSFEITGGSMTTVTSGNYSSFGLTLSSSSLSGTLSQTGTMTLTFSAPIDGSLTVYVVASSTVTIDSVGGTEATVGYEYVYNVQTTPSDATVSISGVSWLSVSGHTISGTPTAAGSYTLVITASASGYASATQTVVIVVSEEEPDVGAPVINDVTYVPSSSNAYRITFTVDVTDASSITVDYGDGTSGTGATSTHTYSSSGSYTVRVVASNASGSATHTLSVLIADSTPSTSVQYNNRYTFTLGIDTDGLTASVTGAPFLTATTGSNYVTVTGIPSSTAYVGQTYTVTLTVGSFSMTWTLTVTEGATTPVAGFEFETDGLTVTVTSTATNADQTFYQWTSNGSFVQSNTGTTSHTYAEPGTYTITQRVTATIDGQTYTDEFSATVTVTESGAGGGGDGDDSGDGGSGDLLGLLGILLIVVGVILLIAALATGSYALAGAVGAMLVVIGAIMRWVL